MTETEKEQIICHYGRLTRIGLYTGGTLTLDPLSKHQIERAFKKRIEGIPLGHILGEAPFYGRSFHVSPDVLIPRPETERLVEETLRVLNAHYQGQKPEILDLGTGSGCIAASLTLDGPDCRMTALDDSVEALGIARKNFKLFGLDKKIRSIKGRYFEAFPGRTWDVIVSNPPYIPSGDLRALPREVRKEPRMALDGGRHGLDSIRILLKQAPRFLKRRGWLLMEIGDGQAERIAKEWSGNKDYASLGFSKDLNGIDRILIAQANG